jgi:fibronectin-binding autotransporter adhesin
VTVLSGGALGLSGGINVIGQTGTLVGTSLRGTGVAGGGALVNVSGNNSYQSNITLTGNATITAGANLLYLGVGYPTSTTAPNSINLNGYTLTFNTTSATGVTPTYEPYPSKAYDATNILVNASGITGSGGIAKTGAGTVTLDSLTSNNFTGNTTVTGGTLIVDGLDNESENHSVLTSNNVYVGNSSSPGSADTVILQTGELAHTPAPNDLIGVYTNANPVSSTNLTIYHDGEFKMNNGADGFNTVTLGGGTIDQGNSVYGTQLSVGTGGIVTTGDGQTSHIENGVVAMSANAFAFSVSSGSTSGVDLQVDSEVQNGAGWTGADSATALVKTGLGTMVFTNNNNSYSGVTDIQNGVLNIQAGGALGQYGDSGFGDTTNGTVVESGAQLQMQGGITVPLETLTLNGSGVGATGALLNVANNNTYNGFIFLGSASRIDANAGTTLTIANTAGVSSGIMNGTGANTNLTVGGSGTVAIDGGIESDVGNVDRDGTGTLILAGSNSYTGATSVAAGVTQVTNNHGLSGTGAVVASGATLQFAEDANNDNLNETNVGVTLNGSGTTGSNGALENVNGNNSYTGNITLASASRINADSGSVLTMNGSVSGTGENLTVGGAGNTNFLGVIGTTTGTLTKDGTGTTTLSNVETYTGLTTVSNGNLVLAANGALGTANTVNVANTGTISTNGLGVVTANGTYGTLTIGTSTASISDSIKALTGSGLVSFGSFGGSTLTINGTVASSGIDTFSGAFSGSGTLVIGAGVTFSLGNNFDDPNLNIVLDAGATLDVLGTNSQFGTLTVDASATLNFSPTQTSVVEFNGTSTPSGGGVYVVPGYTLSVTGWVNDIDYFDSATEPGDGRFTAPLDQIVFDSPTWQGNNTTWNNYADGPSYDADNQITPVPEPSFYGAIAVALAMAVSVGYAIRRRRLLAK